MNKKILFLAIMFMFVFALATQVQEAQAQTSQIVGNNLCPSIKGSINPTMGNIVLSQNSIITVTYNCSYTAYNSEFGLWSPNKTLLGFAKSTSPATPQTSGNTFNLGTFNAGEELIFYIKTPSKALSGDSHIFSPNAIYLNGAGSRNPDGIVHANVVNLGQNKWQIGFEDLTGGAPKDYNDVILTITATPIVTTICSTNSDCGTNGFVDGLFCQANGVYQNFKTYTCNNPGTFNSSCISAITPKLKNQCLSNQTCSNGSCVASCTLNHIKQCVGNNVFWFDSCGNQGQLFQICANGCSNGACTPISLTVETRPATNILTNSATLNGYLHNLGGDPSASVWFQWGPSTAYGFETNKFTNVSAGPFNSTITNLSPNTVYHFRAVAQNGNGTFYGQDMSFTAGNTIYLAQVQTLPATNIMPTAATLNGQLLHLGGDQSAQVWFEWGTSVNYGNETSPQPQNIAGQYSQTISGLTSNTTYHFRAVAQTSAGVVKGSNLTFVTNVGGNIACSNNSDCGTDGFTGGPFCQANGVYKNFTSYTCNNPGTTSSSCTSNTVAQLQQTCTGNQTCSNGSCTASCQNNAYQQCSGNSIYWYDSCGNRQDLVRYCSNGCSGNQCDNYHYNVSQLNLDAQVRNLTSGGPFSNSIIANPGDTVMFIIKLRVDGNRVVDNVNLRDSLPSNLIYQNQMVISGTGAYSGDIIYGLNFGALQPGREVSITYQAQLGQNFPFGTSVLTNNVFLHYPEGSKNGSSSISVNRVGVLGATVVSTGLTNNFWLDSFLLPLMITLLGIWMVKSGMFIGFEKWFNNRKKNVESYKSEKALQNRILQIQRTERI